MLWYSVILSWWKKDEFNYVSLTHAIMQWLHSNLLRNIKDKEMLFLRSSFRVIINSVRNKCWKQRKPHVVKESVTTMYYEVVQEFLFVNNCHSKATPSFIEISERSQFRDVFKNSLKFASTNQANYIEIWTNGRIFKLWFWNQF